MRFASRVNRLAGKGAEAWTLHAKALDQQHETGKDVLFLTVGEPDFDTPLAIQQAAIASMRSGNTHYSPIVGTKALRSAIADWHTELTDQPVSAEQVVVTSGAQCALFCAMQCLAQPGDEVIATDPRYSTYEAVIGATGADLVSVPLLPDRNFTLDLASLRAAVTPRTRVILLNSPHNPTGAVLHPDTLEAVAALCCEADVWLVSDEVYGALTYGPRHRSPAALPGMEDRCVVVSSLSKSHAMTGWRVGWAIAPEAMAGHLYNLVLSMLYSCPGFIQDASVVAIREASGEVRRMQAAYRRRRDLMAPWLDALPGLSCASPEGGMFVMLDVRRSGLDAQSFAERLLAEERVAVLPGEGFGKQAAGFCRLSLGFSDETLTEACRRIEAFTLRLEAENTLLTAAP
ncbi:MAG: aminotransferase class I/II-fold pyridoxal phosphate-dependent enzyme [Rhodospirillales bacterium]|nr:aminotransferase class I/II-fold pyridoxal phosphate-dependent enzyme [Rhodospirillales bacterium]